MVRKDQIRDFGRPTIRRRVVPVDIQDVPRIKPIQFEETSNLTAKTAVSIDIKPPKPRPAPRLVQPRQNKSKVLRRQGLNKLPPFTPRRTKRHTIRWIAVSGCFIVLIGVVTVSIYNRNMSNKSLFDSKGVMSATDTRLAVPTEIEPSTAEKKSHQVASELPRYLSSERLGIEARIKEINLSDSNIEIPDNIHDVGWYRGGGKPGDGRVTVITGSVMGQSRKGALGKASSLVAGDVLTIEVGGGAVHNYIVKEVKSYSNGQINHNELLTSVKPDKEGLNIVALESRFDVQSQNIENNFVVFAVKE